MSISGPGLYSQHAMDEAIVYQPAQQAKAAVPASSSDTQAKDALSNASYQPTISAYGQAQNAMAYLNSTVRSMEESANTGNASENQSPEMQNPDIAKAVRVVQGFIDAYNGTGNGASLQNLEALKGIGITSSNGTLSLDAQAFRKAVSTNPKNTVMVFSALADTVQPAQPHSEPSSNLPLSQYGMVSSLGNSKP